MLHAQSQAIDLGTYHRGWGRPNWLRGPLRRSPLMLGVLRQTGMFGFDPSGDGRLEHWDFPQQLLGQSACGLVCVTELPVDRNAFKTRVGEASFRDGPEL